MDQDKKDFLIWINEIENDVKSGDLNSYAEDSFNKISHKIILKPLYFNEEICMEIDTLADLEAVKILK